MAQIIPFTASDVLGVYAVEEACFPYNAFSKELIGALASHSQCVGFVARNGEEVIGHILARYGADVADILTFAILPENQGQGVGKTLMEKMTEALRSKGVEEVFLDVRPSNVGAIKLYEAYGWRYIATRPNYYDEGEGGAPEDGAVYQLKL